MTELEVRFKMNRPSIPTLEEEQPPAHPAPLPSPRPLSPPPKGLKQEELLDIHNEPVLLLEANAVESFDHFDGVEVGAVQECDEEELELSYDDEGVPVLDSVVASLLSRDVTLTRMRGSSPDRFGVEKVYKI